MAFEKAVQTLIDAEVEFVVVGGLATAFHGSLSDITVNLEVCFSVGAINLKRIVAALAPFHPRPRGFSKTLPFIWEEATLGNASVLALLTDLGEIDLLAGVAGLGSYDEVRANSITVDAFDRKIDVLDLPGLIQAKRAAGRPKDLLVLPELESLLEASQP